MLLERRSLDDFQVTRRVQPVIATATADLAKQPC